jgi:dihydroneopterin aldolase
MPDRLFIERLAVRATHGVQEHEKKVAQDFLVDVSVVFDTRKAGVSDNLQDTVDYGPFRDIVHETLASEPCNLVEHLAAQIAQAILADERILETTVTIRKTSIYDDCVPGISITRRQPVSS